MENLGEMAKFLDEYDLPKLNKEETNKLNSSMMRNEVEAVLPNKENSRIGWIAKF
jgi:hypothetical protein